MAVAKQEMLAAARIDEEALAEAARCCPILYKKRMKEFKGNRRKETLTHFHQGLCRCVVNAPINVKPEREGERGGGVGKPTGI